MMFSVVKAIFFLHFFNAHVAMAFVLTSTFQFNIWILSNWFNNNKTIYIRGWPIVICTFWHENLWTCSFIELFPSRGLLKFEVNLIVQRPFFEGGGEGDKTWHFLCIDSIIPKVVPIISPCYSLSPMFQNHVEKSHFNLTTCPQKFHKQH